MSKVDITSFCVFLLFPIAESIDMIGFNKVFELLHVAANATNATKNATT